MNPRTNLQGDRANLPERLILTDQCYGVIGTYTTRIIVLCHDAEDVAKRHKLVLWDDEQVMLPYREDMLEVNETFYSDWEIME